MEFYCIGISHHTAALIDREPINAAIPDIQAALKHYTDQAERYLGLESEIVMLLTCNRFEIYAVDHARQEETRPQEESFQRLLLFFEDLTGQLSDTLKNQVYTYRNLEAVQHLFRVTAGLDSQVLGETQILGQVAEALEIAVRVKSARHILSTLFRAALSTGKRAHTETKIGYWPASISSMAVHLAEQQVGNLHMRSVVVIGSGEMGHLAIKAFRVRGAQQMTILNRTYASALALAVQYGGKARPYTDLLPTLVEADIVVCATAAQQPILTKDLLRKVMESRTGRSLALLDIALPRNVDPEVRSIPGVRLFDLDDVKTRVNDNLHHRQIEAAHVQAIIEEEVQSFAHWMEVIPTIGSLHRKAEQIRQQEVERVLQHLPDLDPRVQEQIEHLSHSLVKKLLHEPTVKLRKQVDDSQLGEHMDSLKFLFGLHSDGELPGASEDYGTRS